MKCTNCGKTTDDNSKFCIHCGDKLNTEQQVNQNLGESIDLRSDNSISTVNLKAVKIGKQHVKKHWIIISVLVLVMLSIFVALWRTEAIKIPTRKTISDVSNEIEDSNSWHKCFEDVQGQPTSIIPLKGGGYVLAGSKGGTWIMKIDNNGNIDWEKIFGKNSIGTDIVESKDNSLVVISSPTGVHTATISIIKISYSGGLIWEKQIGGSGFREINSLINIENGYLVLGRYAKPSASHSDIWLLMLNNGGDIQWQKTYGGPNHDYGLKIKSINNKRYLLSGYSSNGKGDSDIWLIMIDKKGNIIWDKAYGREGDDYISSIAQTPDKGYVIAGSTETIRGKQDAWIIKLNKSGKIQWDRTFGGSDYDSSKDIYNSKIGYHIVGETNSLGQGGRDLWLLDIDQKGFKIDEETYGGKRDDAFLASSTTPDGGYVIVWRKHQTLCVMKK